MYFGVMTAKEKENGIEGVAANLTNFLLGDFRKGEGCTPLKVDVIRE